ncbi:hypothetical protein D3C78_1362280 [compost metagenome]
MDQLFVFKAAVQVAVGNFPWQVQCAQHQLPGFIPRIVGAMAEKQILPMETADGPTDMVAQGTETGSDHGGKLQKNRRASLPAKRGPTQTRPDDERKTPDQP